MSEQLPFTIIGVVVILAFLISVLMRSLKQNQLLGYILAGMILGPLGLGFLKPFTGISAIFGELGLFVLLFYLGLELSFKKFIGAGPVALLMAFVDMIALAAGGGILVMLLGFSPLFALIVGIMLFCPSTAIVAKFVLDSKLEKNRGAMLALALMILQDFLGILLLVFVTSLSASDNAVNLAMTAVIFAVAMFSIVHRLSAFVEKYLLQQGYSHVQTSLYALGIGLIVATIANSLHLSTALGAYFAGFAMAETQAGGKIKKDLNFLRDFFLLFFFVSFGTTLFVDPVFGVPKFPAADTLVVLAELVIGLSLIIVLTNFLIFGFVGKRIGLANEDASLTAILMTPLGEFVVIIATAAAVVLSPFEREIISPLAFLLILVTVISFQPLLNNKHHHQRLMTAFPENPLPKRKKVVPDKHTDETLNSLRRIATNSFTLICIAGLLLFVYEMIPDNALPVPHARAVTFALLFAVCAAYPLTVTVRSVRFVYRHLKGMQHRGQMRFAFMDEGKKPMKLTKGKRRN